MIRAIIIDDEKYARSLLQDLLNQNCPEISVVDSADSVKSAFEKINLHHPDLLFLDIDMPDGTGFDLLRKFTNIPFKVIFVTGYDNYAVQAFRHSATDYLLKPVGFMELWDAVRKVKREMEYEMSSKNLEVLLQLAVKTHSGIQTLVVPNESGFTVVNLRDIIMCEADGYLTRFYLTDNQILVSSRNLKHYEEVFDFRRFVRVHHSYIVNVDHVKSFSYQGYIILTNDNKASIGNVYKKRFFDLYQR